MDTQKRSKKGNVAAQRKRYRLKYPDKVRAEKRRYRKLHPDIRSAYMKQYNAKTRLEVLLHYSNGTLKCSDCGESHIEFLEIDHLNGNGKDHKREIQCTGISFYRWLKSNNFPEGYQVLCSNCNNKKVRAAENRTKGWLDLRKDVFSHYAIDGKIKCSCPGCDVDDIEVLCMDHINNDGAEHRRLIGKSTNIYSWIQKNGYPRSFRILCHNCNQSIGLRGYCPHEKNFSIFKFF